MLSRDGHEECVCVPCNQSFYAEALYFYSMDLWHGTF